MKSFDEESIGQVPFSLGDTSAAEPEPIASMPTINETQMLSKAQLLHPEPLPGKGKLPKPHGKKDKERKALAHKSRPGPWNSMTLKEQLDGQLATGEFRGEVQSLETVIRNGDTSAVLVRLVLYYIGGIDPLA